MDKVGRLPVIRTAGFSLHGLGGTPQVVARKCKIEGNRLGLWNVSKHRSNSLEVGLALSSPLVNPHLSLGADSNGRMPPIRGQCRILGLSLPGQLLVRPALNERANHVDVRVATTPPALKVEGFLLGRHVLNKAGNHSHRLTATTNKVGQRGNKGPYRHTQPTTRLEQGPVPITNGAELQLTE